MRHQLRPQLGANLAGTARARRLADERAGDVPVRDDRRQDPAHPAVAEVRQPGPGPELGLRDRGHRPRRIDQHDVTGHDGRGPAQEELHPGHPLGGQVIEPGQLRIRLFHVVVHQRPHALDRQRADVVVGLDANRAPGGLQLGVGDARPLAPETHHAGAEVKADAQATQVIEPGSNPHVVRGPVEQPVDVRAGAGMIDPHLHADGADGAGVGAPRTHRHQRAHGDLGEVLAKGRRPAVGVDEVPPAPRLVLGQAPLGGRRQQRQEQRRRVQDVDPGKTEVRQGQRARQLHEVVDRRREARDHVDGRRVQARHARARGRGQVVADAVRISAVGDAGHRVGQVPVERREEAEPMLARQIASPRDAGARHEGAAGLATGAGRGFIDGDVEPPLGQLVGGAEATDPASEDGDLDLPRLGHAAAVYRREVTSSVGECTSLPGFSLALSSWPNSTFLQISRGDLLTGRRFRNARFELLMA